MILIIDDNINEKLGSFKDLLNKSELTTIDATTLEDANRIFESNIDNIDAIILDYAFPESNNNSSFYNQDKIPNGIIFLKENEFKLHIRNIPLIINTSADDEEREYWLKTTTYFNKDENILYKCPAKQPLSFSNSIIANAIIKKIKEEKEKRDAIKNSIPANKIFEGGRTGTVTEKGFIYRREGD